MTIRTTTKLFCFLSITVLWGCVTPSPVASIQGRVETLAEIEAISLFVVDGKTSKEEILSRLGPPGAETEREDGGELLAYYWETPTWVRPENLGTNVGDYFDPFAGGSEGDRTFNMGWLLINLNQNLVVRSHSIDGPQ